VPIDTLASPAPTPEVGGSWSAETNGAARKK
jgi:hypothetical protein